VRGFLGELRWWLRQRPSLRDPRAVFDWIRRRPKLVR